MRQLPLQLPDNAGISKEYVLRRSHRLRYEYKEKGVHLGSLLLAFCIGCLECSSIDEVLKHGKNPKLTVTLMVELLTMSRVGTFLEWNLKERSVG